MIRWNAHTFWLQRIPFATKFIVKKVHCVVNKTFRKSGKKIWRRKNYISSMHDLFFGRETFILKAILNNNKKIDQFISQILLGLYIITSNVLQLNAKQKTSNTSNAATTKRERHTRSSEPKKRYSWWYFFCLMEIDDYKDRLLLQKKQSFWRQVQRSFFLVSNAFISITSQIFRINNGVLCKYQPIYQRSSFTCTICIWGRNKNPMMTFDMQQKKRNDT